MSDDPTEYKASKGRDRLLNIKVSKGRVDNQSPTFTHTGRKGTGVTYNIIMPVDNTTLWITYGPDKGLGRCKCV